MAYSLFFDNICQIIDKRKTGSTNRIPVKGKYGSLLYLTVYIYAVNFFYTLWLIKVLILA